MDRYGVVGPSLSAIRRLHGAKTPDVPLYPDLVADLCKVGMGRHDATAAHVCAVLSCWAYADPDVLATMMVRMGLERNRCRYVALINDAMFVSSKAYYVQSACGRVGFLVYRGTEPFNLLSWATDANVAPIAIPVDSPSKPPSPRHARVLTNGKTDPRGPLVHGGFYVNQRATWFDVESALLDALEGRSVVADILARPLVGARKGSVWERSTWNEGGDTATRIGGASDEPDPATAAPTHKLEALFLTGHSLGGAMAAIAAFRLAHDRGNSDARRLVDKIRGVYTFGQPMIGNEAWARMLTEHQPQYELLTRGLFRHVFDCDAVPSLPPGDAGPFAHTGVELRTRDPVPEQPGWIVQPASVARTPMAAGELPNAFLAFAKRQLPGFPLFHGGRVALPEVTLTSLYSEHRNLAQICEQIALRLLMPLKAKLTVSLPPLNAPFSIYDHLPANYVLASTPANKQNEFGDF